MIIDAFCHIFPYRFIRDYVKTFIPRLLRFAEIHVPAITAYFVDPDLRVQYMDKYGITTEILSISLPGHGLDKIPEKDLLKLTKLANDAMAELCEKYPSRLISAAWLPNLEGDFVDELDRCLRDMGMKGCMIYSNIGGRPLDSPSFMEFYNKMSVYDLPILLHPISWTYYPWIHEYRIGESIGWPFDTSVAMSRLVFGGVLDKFPRLKIITHHLGAMIPYFSERIRLFYDSVFSEPEVYGNTSDYYPIQLKKHPIEYFKSFYADTVIGGNVSALRCAIDFFGIDHIVFATDYPFGPLKGELFTKCALNIVEESGLTSENKEKTLYKNSQQIFKLKNLA
ncbi:MAG: amidohydrolase family protein [Candidatus Caldarchaeum sp.]